MLSAVNQKIDFSHLEFQTVPFDYFILPELLDRDKAFDILSWLETNTSWKLIEADFYTQYEFDFKDLELPKEISFLYERDFLDNLIEKFEELFSVKLKENVDLTAHKLIAGQIIRLHNDFVPRQETHRLLIQLNRSWQDKNGGFLLLFNSSSPEDIHRIIRPAHNSSVGFAISPKSNHAVSTIYNDERYTLVYSFYAKKSVP